MRGGFNSCLSRTVGRNRDDNDNNNNIIIIAGSAGGPDGVRPQHLRDLTSNKEAGPALVTALTAFVNLLMQGKCPSSGTPYFSAEG